MNKNYSIDLSLTPTTLDLWHISLLAVVIALALLLIIVLFAMVIGSSRRAKRTRKDARTRVSVKGMAAEQAKLAASSKAKPEVKIVEKIVEVEKIVQAPAPEPVVLKEATPDAALQLLSILQKYARFIDFIKEDIATYSDADIGVAARVVHEGCNKAMNEYFTLGTVRSEQEGSKVILEKGFNASEVRLTGNLIGDAPFTGSIIHKGWKITDVRLPKLTKGHDAKIVAAAEVEL